MSMFTVCNLDGPRIRHGSHGRTFKRNTMRAAGRRMTLPGYPVPAGPLTGEQIDKYLSGDTIVCLLCGKNYRRLGGPHLEKIHGVSVEEYQDRYAIPYSRGLVSSSCRDRYAESAKAIGHDRDYMSDIRQLSTTTKPKSGLVRMSEAKRRSALANISICMGSPRAARHEIGAQDIRPVIDEMAARDMTFGEVLRARGQSRRRYRDFLMKNPTLMSDVNAAHEALTFTAQARIEQLGDRFAQAVADLRPMSDKKIAAKLGVTAMSVNRIRRKRGIK